MQRHRHRGADGVEPGDREMPARGVDGLRGEVHSRVMRARAREQDAVRAVAAANLEHLPAGDAHRREEPGDVPLRPVAEVAVPVEEVPVVPRPSHEMAAAGLGLPECAHVVDAAGPTRPELHHGRSQDGAGAELCLRPEYTIPVGRHHRAVADGQAADYSYLGPVFRLRAAEPDEFHQAGIESKAYFDPAIHHQRPYVDRMDLRPGTLPATEEASRRILIVPFSSTMTQEQVERVAAALKDGLAGSRVRS